MDLAAGAGGVANTPSFTSAQQPLDLNALPGTTPAAASTAASAPATTAAPAAASGQQPLDLNALNNSLNTLQTAQAGVGAAATVAGSVMNNLQTVAAKGAAATPAPAPSGFTGGFATGNAAINGTALQTAAPGQKLTDAQVRANGQAILNSTPAAATSGGAPATTSGATTAAAGGASASAPAPSGFAGGFATGNAAINGTALQTAAPGQKLTDAQVRANGLAILNSTPAAATPGGATAATSGATTAAAGGAAASAPAPSGFTGGFATGDAAINGTALQTAAPGQKLTDAQVRANGLAILNSVPSAIE